MLIVQLLINLLENTVKYTPRRTPIDLSAEVTRQAVTVAVADRGPGLPPGDEQRIFDKFYQVQRAGAPGVVGLELAICCAIVEAHGGRIWAENRPGGAVVRFTLPLEGTPPQMRSIPGPVETGSLV